MQRELDLIPAGYRERLKIKRWCHFFLFGLLVVTGTTFLLRQLFVNQNQSVQNTIQVLQKNKADTLEQQRHYNELLANERNLQKNIEILNGLREGPSVRKVLQAVDRVLNGNVWFLHWTFMRSGEVVELKPEAVQTGYFIVIPQENSRIGKEQAWKLNTHMEIMGQAKDHLSFSRFVQTLLKQPEIADVKVINTSVRNYVSTEVIDFNLVVVINNQPID